MKLAILNLTGGGISGGHKKYLLNMLPRLAASPEIEAILCASPAAMRGEDWLPKMPKVSYVSCEPFRPFRHSPDSQLAASLDEFKPDLVFIPIERYIKYKKLPVVVMLQNMAPLTGTKTGYGLKEHLVSLVRKYETGLALAKSDAVIAATAYVRDFLVERTGVPAAKLSVIPFGHNKAAVAARPPEAFPFSAGSFVFTAGSLESYRGIEDLIKALPSLKKTYPGIKLAVAGGSRPETGIYLNDLKKLAAGLNVTGDIAWLGNISEEELSWCYANCSAFALTSRIESFCFVALEAMAHGCNIVSTDSACLPEILGDSAIYYAAGDEAGLSKAITAVLSRTEAEHAGFSAASAARATSFSWDKAAAATLEVFKKSLASF